MLDTLKNIVSLSATAIAGTVNRFYYYKVPQNKTFPYVSYYIITETYLGKDTGNLYGDSKLQFNIYSDYSDYGTQCNTVLQEILNYYDTSFKPFAITNGLQVISVSRDFTRPAAYIQDENVWMATIQYNLHILN